MRYLEYLRTAQRSGVDEGHHLSARPRRLACLFEQQALVTLGGWEISRLQQRLASATQHGRRFPTSLSVPGIRLAPCSCLHRLTGAHARPRTLRATWTALPAARAEPCRCHAPPPTGRRLRHHGRRRKIWQSLIDRASGCRRRCCARSVKPKRRRSRSASRRHPARNRTTTTFYDSSPRAAIRSRGASSD